MDKRSFYILFFLLFFSLTLPCLTIHAQSPLFILNAQNDTVKEDNPFAVPDSLKRNRNLAKDSVVLNAMNYKMDTRYMAVGDSLEQKRWYNGLFFQAGIGAEQIMKAHSRDEMHPLTTFFFAFGKQLSKYHSLRLRAQGAIGYTKNSEHLYLRMGGIGDHLFNVTDYLYGYNPCRAMGVSTVIGGGMHYAAMRGTGKKGKSYEVHGGLQLQFYTGPHGTVNLEPYVMLASDNIDLSTNNWRRYDVGLGVNLNFTYYLENHLSRAARLRYIRDARDGQVLPDSTRLYAWQQPWILEIAAGPAVTKIPEMSLSETLGHEVAVSIGKWVSPVVGLRASVMIRNTDWAMQSTPGNNVIHEQYFSSLYNGVRLEGMLNPLGFLRNFRWNAPVGFYLVGGAGVGWLIKHKPLNPLHSWSEHYTAGIHLWARLSEGLQFFVEPRITHNIYNVPYTNKNWEANFSDDIYGVNIGITATSIAKPYRRNWNDRSSSAGLLPEGRKNENLSEKELRWTVGLGGGTNLIPKLSHYKGRQKLPFNFNAFANYRFSNISSVRLSMEFVSASITTLTNYYDLNMSLPQFNYAPVERRGLWLLTNRMGIASLGYEMNLSNAFCGYHPKRLFSLSLFAGPGIAWHIGQDQEIDENEPIFNNHDVRPKEDNPTGTYFVASAGARLTARITSNIGIMLTPQLHYIPKLEIPGFNTSRLGSIETLDLGVQYKF